MKIILLAAAALIAAPVLAQTTSTTTGPTTVNNGPGTSPAETGTTSDPQSTTSQTPSSQSTTDQSTTSQSMPMPATDNTTVAGSASTGGAVRFQAPPSVDQAFPAPAALASYPTCKAGEYDKCMQRSGSTHHAVRSRRHR